MKNKLRRTEGVELAESCFQTGVISPVADEQEIDSDFAWQVPESDLVEVDLTSEPNSSNAQTTVGKFDIEWEGDYLCGFLILIAGFVGTIASASALCDAHSKVSKIAGIFEILDACLLVLSVVTMFCGMISIILSASSQVNTCSMFAKPVTKGDSNFTSSPQSQFFPGIL